MVQFLKNNCRFLFLIPVISHDALTAFKLLSNLFLFFTFSFQYLYKLPFFTRGEFFLYLVFFCSIHFVIIYPLFINFVAIEFIIHVNKKHDKLYYIRIAKILNCFLQTGMLIIR